MKIGLDSNRYVDFQRGVQEAVDVVQTADEVLIPFVVLGELRAGFRLGSRVAENETKLARFIARPRVTVAWADLATTVFYADIWTTLRRSGAPVPTNDVWIAALCIQHGAHLYSRDLHFDSIPRLPRT